MHRIQNLLKKMINWAQRILMVGSRLSQWIGRNYCKHVLSFKDRATLLESLTFTIKAAFHPEIDCFISSSAEFKRSQQILSEENLDWISGFKEGDVFYDIGANIGMFSLFVARQWQGSVKVVAFEPSFSTFASLVRNVAINHVENTVTCFQVALADSTRQGTFNYTSLQPGGSLHSLDSLRNYRREIFEPIFQQPVLSFALDDMITEFCLPLPTHIKLDVDGTEWEILTGCERTLRSGRVKSITVEIVDLAEEDERTKTITQFLGQCGFNCYGKLRHTKTLDFPRVSDYFFVKVSA